MSALDRRHFLRASGAGLLLPAFLLDAFAQDPEPGERSALERARAEAARTGKPLLVFLKPAREETHAYGEQIGDLIVHADDALLADLALIVGTVATVQELRAAYGKQVPQDLAGTTMVLVETEGAPRDLVPVTAELAARPDLFNVKTAEARKRARAWIAPLQEALRVALSGGADTLARRERAARAALSEAARAATLEQLGRKPRDVDAEAVWTGAALLRTLAVGDDAGAQDARTLLVRATRAKLLVRAPLGGIWYSSSGGCAGSYSDEEGQIPLMVQCGLGHIGAESRRFLRYYIEPHMPKRR